MMAPPLIVFCILFYACVVQSCLGATVRSENTKTCTTELCKKTAKQMLSMMDKDVSPCDDFYKYACGTFLRETKLDEERELVGSLQSMHLKDTKFKRELLESPIIDRRPNSFEAKMKTLYKACMDTDAIERRGVKDYKQHYRDDWPTLNTKWTEASFDLQSLNTKFSKMLSDILFSIHLFFDATDKKEGTYILEFDQPAFMLGAHELKAPRDSEKLLAYEQYYVDVATALGGDKYTAEYDAKGVIDFMRDISEYFGDPSSRWDPTVTRNPTTLEKMNRDYPYLDWVKMVQAKFKEMNIDVKPNQEVNIVYTKYFKGLESVLVSTDKRIIQNLFGSTKAIAIVNDATEQLRDSLFTFQKTFNVTREEKCVNIVDGTYNYGMAKLMAYPRYTKKSKDFMDDLIINIKDAYIDSLENQNWLADSTKQEAIKKVKSLKSKIGLPSENFEKDDLEEYYRKYKVGKKMYIKDLLQNGHQNMINAYERLNKPQDWRWPTSLTTVNAFHLQAEVAIVFTLGILQSPMFNKNYPGYLNYGAIGSVIGHEIGHSLDTSGRRYDAKGQVRDWWTSMDGENYDKKAKCYIDQYSKFFEPQVNMSVNGTKSRSENIADNMGILQAYKAYINYASKHPDELPLPDLGLTKEQLFFLANAQVWCFKASDDYLKMLIEMSSYPPYEFRPLGMAQNSKAFSDAFSCKKGDYMNPEEKCTMW